MSSPTRKILHAADLHLDSPMVGLERYDGAPVERLRGATRSALIAMVDFALGEQVDLVLIAGDVYDGSWRDFNTGLFFLQQMRRLAEAKIPVVAISGNHDAANHMTRQLDETGLLHRLPADTPGSHVLDDIGIAVHGQSFASRAVEENLAAAYPEAKRGLLNIGLLHTSCDGREGHDTYAPCSLDDLRRREYAYWALGHIHRREVVSEEPFVVFPGNLQGRHARETGAKGVTLLTADAERVTKVEHIPLDVVRWHRLPVDVSEAGGMETSLERIAGAFDDLLDTDGSNRLNAVRINLVGATAAHAVLRSSIEQVEAEVRNEAMRRGNRLWVEGIRLRTQPRMDREAIESGEAFQVASDCLRQLADADAAAGVLKRARNRLAQVPDLAARLGDEGWLAARLDEAEGDLLQAFAEGASRTSD